MILRTCFVAGLLAALASATGLAEDKAADVPEQSGPPPLALQGPRPEPVPTPKPEEIDAAIRRGVDFLVEHQEKNGAWGTIFGTKPYNVLASVPGSHHAFRAAVTALCISALIETGGERPEVKRAIDRGEAWLLENLPRVRRANPSEFYNSWTHAYGIAALVRLLDYRQEDKAKCRRIRELIEQQIEMLRRYEVVDGGWAYYDFNAHTKKPSGSSISFVTATVLIAFHKARQAGIEIPERLVERGLASIRRQRNPDFAYMYGEYLKMRPRYPINRPGGSLGRSQVCNLAMRLWGDEKVTDAVLKTWLNRLFARNLWLDIGRKRPIPHESWFKVAGYFFYYGHYYAALCIEELPAEDRPEFQDQLAHILLRLQEKDGSWWDYPLYNYHQQYGTAMALMSLHRCRRAN
jgi:hypothetical protein